jgi:hypothetical protein
MQTGAILKGLTPTSTAPRARVSTIAAGAVSAEQIFGDVKALDIRSSGEDRRRLTGQCLWIDPRHGCTEIRERNR